MEIKAKFQFFHKHKLTYLDSAATTQVPDIVIRAVGHILEYRGNPDRSAHGVAIHNKELLEEARSNIGKFIGADTSEIVFTNNTTDAINLAVDAIIDHIKSDDEVILSVAEHHSNILPYLKLVKKGVKIRMVGLNDGVIDIEEIKKMLNTKTRIVAIGHCSNVLGNINDVEKIGSVVKKYNEDILYLIDGAQAVAHLPVNVKKYKANFYVFSSHKMYGPDGVGVLYVSNNIHHLIAPSRVGGGAVKNIAITSEKEKDIISPDYYQSLITLESGTPNSSNIVGISKAVNFIQSIGFDEIRNHELALLSYLLDKLKKIGNIVIFGPMDLDKKIGVISFCVKEYSTKELCDYLTKQRICIRYGSHCAYPLSEYLGQESLRVSIGVYNDQEDIDHLLEEIRIFFNKKQGLIENKNLELLRKKTYYKNTIIVHSAHAIIEKIMSTIYNPQETEVVVMGGHFLAIPDMQENRFWPSIRPLLPERLHGLLEEFGMTNFPLFTWELACKAVANLKSQGITAKMIIIANDTTGINELRLSNANKNERTAKSYRDELLKQFSGEDGIPREYLDIAKEYNLTKKDIIENGKEYYFQETILRANFKKFISKNKEYFSGVIDYKVSDKNIDISINILDNQQIKTCNFDTFHSKTGGKFCIVELCEFIAELFGKAPDVSFRYVAEKVKTPKIDSKHKMLVVFTPAMCDNAVTRAGELYTKLFLQEKGIGSFKFFNIPLGPNTKNNLNTGTEMKCISDGSVATSG